MTDRISIPAPSARFRPRADAGVLSDLLQRCWREKTDALTALREQAGVGEITAAHLEARFPATDMVVLAKYHAAKAITEIGVRIYNPATERWDATASIELPRAVMTPGHYGAAEIYACGPRWSQTPDRGVSAKYRAELEAEGKWEAFCADQDDHDAHQLPESAEPFFAELVAASNAYKAEYRQTTDWPQARKDETGTWPTWAEIEAAFPTLGAYAATVRSTSP